MELLSGDDLARLIARDGPQPIGLSVRWIIEACDAIAEAHRLGIIHRDIKPSNLLLCSTGSIKILDFGIAKRIAPREAPITLGVAPLGTPQYMSPEQIRCATEVDARSDIWSLGVTLYELVTGRPPYDHDIPQACIAAIVMDPVPDPRELRSDLPDDLAALLMRALSKNPDDRFQTVDDLVLALAPFADPPAVPDAQSARASSVACDVFLDSGPALEADGVIDRHPVSREVLGARRARADESYKEATLGKSWRAHVRSRKKRVRSALALTSAAVLGVTVLIGTPRCVSSRVEHGTPKVTLPATAHVDPTVVKAAIALSSTPTPSTDTVPSQEHDDLTPTRADTHVVHPPPKTAKSARPQDRAPTRTRSRGEPFVHGGISNPGF